VNHEEYLALQRVEREHWFYKGKRDLTRYWISKAYGQLSAQDVILDAGAGTGEFVREMNELSNGYKVVGVEYAAEGRRIARELNHTELLEGSILALPLADDSVSVAVALDVLEHVENDALALAELLRVTKPGGVVIINVPAFQSLWSDWDVVLEHRRRYTRAMLDRLLTNETRRATTVHIAYINSVEFLPILAYRMVSKVIRPKSRAEDKVPGAIMNGLLYSLFVKPAEWSWFKPPFGVSLFAVLRKK
jgi:ubiquinone/menaquinone biosynthesis C-methylase UbiE